MNTSPKIVTTPEVNISFSTSMSLVTRVISRPTGFLSKNLRSSRCRCAEELVPQVDHDALADPRGEERLRVAEPGGQDERAEVEPAEQRQERGVPFGKALSIANLVSHGPTSSSPEAAISIADAAATCHR